MGDPLECVIMIGLPGAGKSTLARQRFPDHVYISEDAFPPSAKDKASRQAAALRAALAGGRAAVVDNTNVTLDERAAIIAVAREFGARVTGIYVEATPRQAIARNERRSGRERVPKVAIFTCAKRLVPPSGGEGFDELTTMHVQADGSVA
jgi:predicted kinase